MSTAPSLQVSLSLITPRALQTRIQELRNKALSSRQKADEAKASQAANTSQNKVLESLTKLANAGHISGFHVCPSYLISLHFLTNCLLRAGSEALARSPSDGAVDVDTLTG
jgi:regulator of replication initiation timing